MQIVIDIDEEVYINIVRQVEKRDYPDMDTGRAIINGTPLPKGHGRLIDADEIDWNVECFSDGTLKSVLEQIRNAPTVIEADKE